MPTSHTSHTSWPRGDPTSSAVLCLPPEAMSDRAAEPASTDNGQIGPAPRAAVSTIPNLSPTGSRPIRPPAYLPPVRYGRGTTERRADATEQGWRDLDAASDEPLVAGTRDPFSLGLDPTTPERRAQFDRAELSLRVTRAQAIGAASAALVAAILALSGEGPGAAWSLALAVLVGAGASCAYLLLQRRGAQPLAAIVLLCSQLGVFAWAFALVGARPALLAFVPALVVLALRLSGRGVALGTAAALLALYLALTAAHTAAIIAPSFVTSDVTGTLLDAGVATAGLLLSLVAVLALYAGERGALRLAEQRRRDADDLLAGYTILQESVRRDAARLETALAAALRGQSVEPVAPHVADPALYQLAELFDLATARLETLHRDREDRVRLEGATRRVARAVDQLASGHAPTWPNASGTLVDALVTSLRRLEGEYGQGHRQERVSESAQPTPMAPITQISPISQRRASRQPASVAPPRRGRTTGLILPWPAKRSQSYPGSGARPDPTP